MIDKLQFVKGAVAGTDLIPVLTHFCIYNGRLQGSNGRTTLDIEFHELDGLNVAVPATKFIAAINACKGVPQLSFSDTNLTITKGRFKSKIGFLPHEAYPIAVLGNVFRFKMPPLLEPLKELKPFVSVDASRPWSNSILIQGEYLFATNNVAMVRYHLLGMPENIKLILPAAFVDELIRIKVEPIEFGLDTSSVYAFYEDGSWVKTQLLNGDWPDMIGKLNDTISSGYADAFELDSELLEGVESISKFFPDEKLPIVVFSEKGIGTNDGVHSAIYEYEGLTESAYHYKALHQVLLMATHIDTRNFPAPLYFRNANIEGILAGYNNGNKT